MISDHAPLGVGILGAGGIAATSHLPEIAEVPGLRVVALAGRKERRLELLAERFDVPRWYTDWDALLGDPGVDAVVIGLPHPLHVRAAIKVLEAGKHLLMTKPLCTSMAEAHELVRACEAHPDLTVYIRPDVPEELYAMRASIAAGDIGIPSSAYSRYGHGGPELYYAEVARFFGEPEPEDDLWFFDKARAEVGVLFDLGVYAVTRLCAVLGPASRVRARLETRAKPTELDDTASILIEFASGVTGTAITSWCEPSGRRTLEVNGTAGSLLLPGDSGRAVELQRPNDPGVINSPTVVTALDVAPARNQHAEWLDCIRAGVQPATSHVWFARHVTEALLAAAESHRTGRVVELETSPYPARGVRTEERT
jgi:predicted dehydrogenase